MTLSAAALSDKIEHEGGVLAALEYGLKASDIEDPFLSGAWAAAEQIFTALTEETMKFELLLGTTVDAE